MTLEKTTKALITIALAGLLLPLLGGCGEGGDSSTPAMGRISLKIHWPGAQTRLIPSFTETLEVAITGPGIDPAITGSITRPENTITLEVPAGHARTVEVAGKDGEGEVGRIERLGE